MLFELKTWTDGRVLYAGEHATAREAVEAAVGSGCDFRGCDLSGCDFRGCDLRGCKLSGCKLAYRSHDLIAEILRRAAGDDTEKLKIAGYVLVCRDKCWDAFAKLAAVDPLGDWALNELAKWVQPDDGAPEVLRKRAEKLATA